MTRDHLDRYYTPAWVTESLLKRIPMRFDARILEPCAGQGGIADVLRGHHLHTITGDIDPDAPVDHHWDFTQARIHPQRFRDDVGFVHWIITNPPYAQAESIIRGSLELCGSVAMLLRLTWLEPVASRLDLLQELRRIIITPRVSYSGDGSTDSTGSAWLIWNYHTAPGPYGPTVEWIPKSERPPRSEQIHRPLGRTQDPLQGSLLGGDS